MSPLALPCKRLGCWRSAELEVGGIETSLPLEGANSLPALLMHDLCFVHAENDSAATVADFANTPQWSVRLTDLKCGVDLLAVLSLQ